MDVAVDALLRIWQSRYNARSAKALELDVRHFLLYVQKDLRDVSSRDVAAYMDGLDGLSHEVLRRKLRSIKSFCRFLSENGHIPVNVAASYTNRWPKPEPELRYVSKNVVQDIIDCAETERELLILSLLYYCAMSVDEMASLRWKDLYTSAPGPRLRIRRGKRKRTVAIPPHVEKMLAALRKDDARAEYPILTSAHGRSTEPLAARTVSGIVSRIIARTPHHVTPQILRNSHAAHVLARGGSILDVQAALGHTSLRSTLRHARRLKGVARTSKLLTGD